MNKIIHNWPVYDYVYTYMYKLTVSTSIAMENFYILAKI